LSQPSLDDALKHHQAGRLAKAHSLYMAILEKSPGNGMAMHYLGVIAQQSGKADEALDWMTRSIAANPNIPEFHSNLGILYRDLGRLDQAAAALCQAIRLHPKFPQALTNLGDVLRMQDRLAEAEDVLRKSLSIRPSLAALNNLGLVLIDAKRPEQAIEFLQKAMELAPGDPLATRSLAIAKRRSGPAADALPACRAAVDKSPADADAWFGLGNALRANHDLPAAADAFRQALRLRSDHPEILLALCGVLTDLGELPSAIEAGSRAIAIEPKSHPARYNLALALLKSGSLREAWEFYESRWHCPGYVGSLPELRKPKWNGSNPAGRTILIRAEQGCGDTIQFSRYLPMLAQQGAKVILECQAELKPLLANLPGIFRVIARGEKPAHYDFHLPLLSLPGIFLTSPDSIPASTPYLHVDIQRTAMWAGRMAQWPEFKCGLVWAGSANHHDDRNRSIPLSALTPLAAVRGIRFFSLQKDQTPDASFPGLIDLSPHLTDFAETAAALAQLDLLISVDTSTAHLAGALARPVWTLLPHDCDWRWMTETNSTPWYRTMRLIRQTARGDWSGAIQQAAEQLAIKAPVRRAA
jgi:tetratricopeptide (TPR) repeat protein